MKPNFSEPGSYYPRIRKWGHVDIQNNKFNNICVSNQHQPKIINFVKLVFQKTKLYNFQNKNLIIKY